MIDISTDVADDILLLLAIGLEPHELLEEEAQMIINKYGDDWLNKLGFDTDT